LNFLFSFYFWKLSQPTKQQTKSREIIKYELIIKIPSLEFKERNKEKNNK